MKIWAISLCLLVLLTGCDASSEMERGMALRSLLLNAKRCTMDVNITADYGDTINEFALTCCYNEMGNMEFTVVKPESIEGITGKISGNAGSLTFDDTVLYFELLADGQLSPVSAPWILMKTLRSGYIRAACEEDGMIRLTMDDSFEDDALQLDVWLNEKDLPVRGEILFQSRRILSLDVENFDIS